MFGLAIMMHFALGSCTKMYTKLIEGKVPRECKKAGFREYYSEKRASQLHLEFSMENILHTGLGSKSFSCSKRVLQLTVKSFSGGNLQEWTSYSCLRKAQQKGGFAAFLRQA